jgi:hypothetical protein
MYVLTWGHKYIVLSQSIILETYKKLCIIEFIGVYIFFHYQNQNYQMMNYRKYEFEMLENKLIYPLMVNGNILNNGILINCHETNIIMFE